MFVTFELHFNTGVLIPLTACSLLSVCCVGRHSCQLHSRLEQTRTTGAVSSGGLWASPALPGVWLSWIWTRVTAEREGAGACPLAACGGRLCSHSDIQSWPVLTSSGQAQHCMGRGQCHHPVTHQGCILSSSPVYIYCLSLQGTPL